MERSRIQQVINELGLQSTQNISARAVEIGNLLGVHKIIVGECIHRNYFMEANLRLIDVESGGIEAAVSMDSREIDSKGNFKRWRGYPVSLTERAFAQKLLNALLR